MIQIRLLCWKIPPDASTALSAGGVKNVPRKKYFLYKFKKNVETNCPKRADVFCRRSAASHPIKFFLTNIQPISSSLKMPFYLLFTWNHQFFNIIFMTTLYRIFPINVFTTNYSSIFYKQ